MNIIISNKLKQSFTNFTVIEDIDKYIYGVTDEVDVLIIHSMSNEIQALATLQRITNFKKLYYINEVLDTSIGALVQSKGGFIFSDDFYLEDEDELIALTNGTYLPLSQEECTQLSEVGESSIIVKRFLEDVARGVLGFPPYRFEEVNNAIEAIDYINKELVSQSELLSATVLNTYGKMNDLIDKYKKTQSEITKKLNETKTPNQPLTSLQQGVNFFPAVNITTQKPVLYIREYGSCRYLTTFLLAYKRYLEIKRHLKVKLVFIIPKGLYQVKKYSKFTTIISEESSRNQDISLLYKKDIVAINTPLRAHLLGFLDDNNCNVTIVVDRTNGTFGGLGGRLTTLNAVSGITDITLHSLDTKNTIFTITKPADCLFLLKTFERYPLRDEQRYAAYNQGYIDEYKILDDRLKI